MTGFASLPRRERRAAIAIARATAARWPTHLEPVPESEWPSTERRPIAVWRSRQYFAQLYAEPELDGRVVRRLSVNRVSIGNDGEWRAEIPWDDLQRIKRETGHGDWYGLEIYPRERDLVHVANMRHLWLMAEPLALGWFK